MPKLSEGSLGNSGLIIHWGKIFSNTPTRSKSIEVDVDRLGIEVMGEKKLACLFMMMLAYLSIALVL